MPPSRPNFPLSPLALGALTLRADIPLERIDAASWDALGRGQPLLSHAFLTALHESGCASPARGWTPHYLTVWHGRTLAGALPLYAKTHSYGEYVFDWSWADAYRRHGLSYYPKLVAAIPFTPTPGPRVLAPDPEVRRALLRHAMGMLRGEGYSSLHVLLATEPEIREASALGMFVRHGVQFHWKNAGYASFAEFLGAFNHDKRKKVKQDRRRLAEAGVNFTRSVGPAISEDDWDFFFACYCNTYRQHGSTAYLTRGFFRQIAAAMPAHLLLVLGWRNGQRICAALDVFDRRTLWGRYWGATEYIPGLHFEACYYQALEFCIEQGLEHFEGGAQGVHKLARGLLPVATHSAHAIADPAFARAIGEFCARERSEVGRAVDELAESSPFRAADASSPGFPGNATQHDPGTDSG